MQERCLCIILVWHGSMPKTTLNAIKILNELSNNKSLKVADNSRAFKGPLLQCNQNKALYPLPCKAWRAGD